MPRKNQIVTASMPQQAFSKSYETAGLAVYFAPPKYQDALSLYRQENIFKRHDIEIPSAIIANWMIKLSEELFSP